MIMNDIQRAKVRELLAYTYERLDPLDKVLSEAVPGMVAHNGMNPAEMEYILQATGTVVAIADRAWLFDDEDLSLNPRGSDPIYFGRD